MSDKKPDVHGGQFYAKMQSGRFVEVPADLGGRLVDQWICRRVADFPRRELPVGGAVDVCSRCGEPIVYNTRRTILAPKICMQCASIQPLPIEP